MKADINLALGALVESAQKSRLLRILRITALASITLILIASVSLFLLINSTSTDKIKKEEDKILFSIKYLHDKEAKILIINERLNGISKILGSRGNYDLLMNAFLQKIPQDTSVDSFGVDKNKIVLTVSSDSLSSMDDLIDSFIDMVEKQQIIKNLTIESLTSDRISGIYILSIKADRL
ncbi:MAG: hypothetical protein A3B44_02180 [Candidatus Levybacteria bacterium RIFCSPLOWO2_01_FULL_38_21]|nr:MAG: hypothetical protein A3B44_02180 [Candidatus Levybacteria bacterium RIFCSPLOWO2_01_FULL_38_21]